MKLLKFSDITPGTWVAVGYLVESTDVSVPDVCSVDPRDFGQGKMPIDEKSLKSNALLLAAAPRLLLALDSLAVAVSLSNIEDPDVIEAMSDAFTVIDSIGLDLEEL